MTVFDDSQTSVSFIEGAHAAYFEGNNILVKIDGHGEDSKGANLPEDIDKRDCSFRS